LLDQLAVGKLQRKARKVAAEGWKWVDVRPRYVHDEYVRHGELRKFRREPTQEEAQVIQSLQEQIAAHGQRIDELYDGDGQEDDEGGVERAECARLEALCDEMSAQVDTRQEALTVWPPELMVQAGCVVYVGNDAAPAVRYGLIRPDDREAVVQATRSGESAESGQGDALASLPAPKTRPVHSEKLVRNLTAHRVAAIQAELLGRSDVALAVLTAQMAKSLLLEDYRQAYGCEDPLTLKVSDTHACLRNDAEDAEQSVAWQQLDAERARWQAVLPTEGAGVLPWVLEQDAETVRKLFTFLVAITVTGVYATEPAQQRTDGIAQALGLDMSKWWTATATSYFQHVPKARAVEVVGEATGVHPGAAMHALKKDAAVAYAERAISGKAWLPSILRSRAGGSGSAPADEHDCEGAGSDEHGAPCELPSADALCAEQALGAHPETH
jgi:ParB family chromosome partitioning protein